MEKSQKREYRSLENFLISSPLSIDAQLTDAWNAEFTVKGREIEAALLFADMGDFTTKTREMNSTGTLLFVNEFLTWMTHEAVMLFHGIIDKYIGDEIMIVFSGEFGSEDPVADAVRTARWMGERDVYQFCPHIGIAHGQVTVGYVGTHLRFECSVFGLPVVLAKRCASIQPSPESFSSIFLPAELLDNRLAGELSAPRKYSDPSGRIFEVESPWNILPSRTESLKHLGQIAIVEIANTSVYLRDPSDSKRVNAQLDSLRNRGLYKPSGQPRSEQS